jgi:hypothetical protein
MSCGDEKDDRGLCCYAISFGIKRYAQFKENRDTKSEAAAILLGKR